jgi:hypothetical protein
MNPAFKHRFPLLLACILLPLAAQGQAIDLLAAGADAWENFDESRWQIVGGELHGRTAVFDGDKTDPASSAFLLSKRSFDGDFIVLMEVSFERGRYLGVYLDYDPDEQSGMWLGTGHALPPDAPGNEVERGYIKTIDKGFWIVRATSELPISQGERVRVGFSNRGDDYSLWTDGRLIATYRKEGGYPAGRVQLRLTNAEITIHSIKVRSPRGRQ